VLTATTLSWWGRKEAGEEADSGSGRVVPEFGASSGVKGIDVFVIAPHIHGAVDDGGGGGNGDSGRVVPEHSPARGVQRVDDAIK